MLFGFVVAVTKYGTPLSSIGVDNAAKCMASQVAIKFKTECGRVVLILCEPSHCINLCFKDFAKTHIVLYVLADCKQVRYFVKIDYIGSMREMEILLIVQRLMTGVNPNMN